MRFRVYRSLETGWFQHLGSTLFLEDAEHLLKRWGSGYIVDNEGALIETKGNDPRLTSSERV